MRSFHKKQFIVLTTLLIIALIVGCGSGRSDSDNGGNGDDTQTQLTVESLSLSTDKTSVPTDNSNPANIKAQVKSPNNVGVGNSTVEFSATDGLLSKSKVITDSNGIASVEFSSGTSSATNKVATITASVSGADNKQIPIKMTGTSMTLEPESKDVTLSTEDEKNSTLTVILKDSSEVGINDATVNVNVIDGEENLKLSNSKTSGNSVTGNTGPTGEVSFNVTGTALGESTVQIEALNLTHKKNYKIESPEKVLKITSPSESPVALNTNDVENIKADIPSDIDNVMFSTSLGEWVKTQTSTVGVTETSNKSWTAQEDYNATQTGTATIEVYAKGNIQQKDSLTIVTSAPSDQAEQIDLQLSATKVLPSTGNVENTVEVTAKVRTSGGSPVGNAPVLFTLDNTSGGGESISPSTVYTDSSGQATTYFTSGSRPSGKEGVKVTGEVLVDNVDLKDSKNIVIGGVAGSISIGTSTEIKSNDDDTAYRLPMSVLVTDSNGNAVSNAEVNLSAWPTRFRVSYLNSTGDVFTAIFPNEDKNRNLIKDPNEDCSDCAYIADNELTPPQAAAGSLPTSVTTNEAGIANFELQYLKQYAIWVETEIKASTRVLGTESISTLKFWLAYAEDDEDNLPSQPFNPKGTNATNSTF